MKDEEIKKRATKEAKQAGILFLIAVVLTVFHNEGTVVGSILGFVISLLCITSFVLLVRAGLKALSTIHYVERLTANPAIIDKMKGQEFEEYCGRLLRLLGYQNVRVTPPSGDFGADIVAYDADGKKWVFQCKRYASKLGNKPIQEVVAAMRHYGATCAGVITNSHFTESAKLLALENGVSLTEREDLFLAVHKVNTAQAEDQDAG